MKTSSTTIGHGDTHDDDPLVPAHGALSVANGVEFGSDTVGVGLREGERYDTRAHGDAQCATARTRSTTFRNNMSLREVRYRNWRSTVHNWVQPTDGPLKEPAPGHVAGNEAAIQLTPNAMAPRRGQCRDELATLAARFEREQVVTEVLLEEFRERCVVDDEPLPYVK